MNNCGSETNETFANGTVEAGEVVEGNPVGVPGSGGTCFALITTKLITGGIGEVVVFLEGDLLRSCRQQSSKQVKVPNPGDLPVTVIAGVTSVQQLSVHRAA